MNICVVPNCGLIAETGSNKCCSECPKHDNKCCRENQVVLHKPDECPICLRKMDPNLHFCSTRCKILDRRFHSVCVGCWEMEPLPGSRYCSLKCTENSFTLAPWICFSCNVTVTDPESVHCSMDCRVNDCERTCPHCYKNIFGTKSICCSDDCEGLWLLSIKASPQARPHLGFGCVDCHSPITGPYIHCKECDPKSRSYKGKQTTKMSNM